MADKPGTWLGPRGNPTSQEAPLEGRRTRDGACLEAVEDPDDQRRLGPSYAVYHIRLMNIMSGAGLKSRWQQENLQRTWGCSLNLEKATEVFGAPSDMSSFPDEKEEDEWDFLLEGMNQGDILVEKEWNENTTAQNGHGLSG